MARRSREHDRAKELWFWAQSEGDGLQNTALVEQSYFSSALYAQATLSYLFECTQYNPPVYLKKSCLQ